MKNERFGGGVSSEGGEREREREGGNARVHMERWR